MHLIYTIPALAAASINLLIFLYIITTRRKRMTQLNVILALMTLFAFVFSIGDFLTKISGSDVRAALGWNLLTITGAEIGIFLYLLMTLVYPRPIRALTDWRVKTVLAGVFCINVFSIVNSLIGYFSNRQLSPEMIGPEGFFIMEDLSRTLSGTYHSFGLPWISVIIITAFTIQVYRYLVERSPYKKAIGLLILATVIMFGTGMTMEFVLSIYFNIKSFGFSSFSLTLMAIIFGYTVLRFNVLSIKLAPEIKTIDIEQPLEGGYYYAVAEKDIRNPVRSYEMFIKHVRSGMPGLIVTMAKPSQIRKKYGLQKVPIIHIVEETNPAKAEQEDEKQEDNVLTIPLLGIRDSLELIREIVSKSKDGIVLVDCYPEIVRAYLGNNAHRAMILEVMLGFTASIVHTGSVMVLSLDCRMTGREAGTMLRFKRLLGSTPVGPQLLLEQMLNRCVEGFSKEQRDRVAEAINKLKKMDTAFSRASYRDGFVSMKPRADIQFTPWDCIRHFKMFFAEIADISRLDEAGARKTLEQAGFSAYEYDLEPGHGYLINGSTPEGSFTVFTDMLDHEHPCLMISRQGNRRFMGLPEGLRNMGKYLWLTDADKSDGTVIPRLEHISREVEEFVTAVHEYPPLIVLENLPYLIKFTGSFDEVHLFVARLRDIVSANSAILVIPVEEGTLSAEERACLRQELIETAVTPRNTR